MPAPQCSGVWCLEGLGGRPRSPPQSPACPLHLNFSSCPWGWARRENTTSPSGDNPTHITSASSPVPDPRAGPTSCSQTLGAHFLLLQSRDGPQPSRQPAAQPWPRPCHAGRPGTRARSFFPALGGVRVLVCVHPGEMPLPPTSRFLFYYYFFLPLRTKF